MSRAYRIAIKESLSRIVRAEDHVSTQLELLEILPAEQMAELLRAELVKRGFRDKGGLLVRTDDDITIEIDPASATVKVKAQGQEALELEVEKNAIVDRDWDESTRDRAKREAQASLRQDLEKQASQKAAKLQQQITEKLEGRLGDIRKELDQAINRVTAEALKQKAAQMGQIKEMTEDPSSGSLTIVLEV